MFRFADLGKVWVPVSLPMGGDADGGEVEVRFLFRLFTRKELRDRERDVVGRTADKLAAELGKVRTPEELLELFDQAARVEEADVAELVGRTSDWGGFGDGEGAELGFTAERFESLLEHQWVFRPVREALFRASREGVRKNSSPGPAGSPTQVQA